MIVSRREFMAAVSAGAGGAVASRPGAIVMRDGLREIKRRAVEWARAMTRDPWIRIPPSGSIYREFYDLADYALRKAGRS